MRPIKFRVINERTGELICTEWLDGDGWKHDFHKPFVTNGVFHFSLLGDGFLDNLLRLQFTGLKDKDGTEVYEGDKIKIKWDTMSWGRKLVYDFTGIVRLGEFESIEREGEYDIILGWYIESGESKMSLLEHNDEGLVLGNIHENNFKELSKDTKIKEQ